MRNICFLTRLGIFKQTEKKIFFLQIKNKKSVRIRTCHNLKIKEKKAHKKLLYLYIWKWSLRFFEEMNYEREKWRQLNTILTKHTQQIYISLKFFFLFIPKFRLKLVGTIRYRGDELKWTIGKSKNFTIAELKMHFGCFCN